MTDRLRVGIIGAGWWAGEHAKAVQATPETELVAFTSRSPERRSVFQAQFGVEGIEDYRALLDRADIDAVAIATPHDVHAAIAIDALDAGKHVLLEKPMARNREECAAITDAVRRSRRRLMLGLTQHFIPTVAAAKAILDRGELGQVLAGLCGIALIWNWHRRPRFYLDRALGGGAWLTHGVHYVDRLLWLTGSDPVSAKGVMDRRFHTPAEQQSDDMVSAFFLFANGATGTILLAAQRDGPPWDQTQLICERGGLRFDRQTLSFGQGQEWQDVPPKPVNPMAEEWSAFAHSLLTGAELPITLDYALTVMDATFAIEDSSALGQEVTFSTRTPSHQGRRQR